MHDFNGETGRTSRGDDLLGSFLIAASTSETVTAFSSVSVLRRIGGRGHFRSRDKDGGHSIRSAIADNPILYANFPNVSFTEPDLLPIEVLHCENREFRVFFAKNSGHY